MKSVWLGSHWVMGIRCCLAEIYSTTTWQSCRPASSIRCLCLRFCAYLLVEAWYSAPSLFSMYLLLHTRRLVPSQGTTLFRLDVVDWSMQPFRYCLCLSLSLQASVWSRNQNFVSPYPQYHFQAQPRVAGCFHPSLPRRPLNENDLTELPAGIFDSLTLLNFLYVLAKKKKAHSCLLESVLWSNCIFFFWREKKGREGEKLPSLLLFFFNRGYPLMTIFASW